MKEAVGAAIGLIVIAVIIMIGGSMVAVTQNVTLGLVSNTSSGYTMISTLATYTGNSLTTFASLLSVLALAVIGGLAIGYLVFFLGGVFGGGRGAM